MSQWLTEVSHAAILVIDAMALLVSRLAPSQAFISG